jgi:hypothetical protein
VHVTELVVCAIGLAWLQATSAACDGVQGALQQYQVYLACLVALDGGLITALAWLAYATVQGG